MKYFSLKRDFAKDKLMVNMRKMLCEVLMYSVRGFVNRVKTKPEASLSDALAVPFIFVPPFDENRARLASLTCSNNYNSFLKFRVLIEYNIQMVTIRIISPREKEHLNYTIPICNTRSKYSGVLHREFYISRPP